MKVIKIALEGPEKNTNTAKVAMLYKGIYTDKALNLLLTDNGIKEYEVVHMDKDHVIVKYTMKLIDSKPLPDCGVKNSWKNQLDGNMYYTIQYI